MGNDLIGVGTVRAIVEAQHQSLRRQVAAEDLAVAVLHRHRIGHDHAVVAQDLFAGIQLAQARHVVVPFFTLLHDAAGGVEAAEDASDLFVVAALDLDQRIQVVADALSRRMAGSEESRDSRACMSLQHFGEASRSAS